MSRDRIKWIAMAAMLVDHAAIVFLLADGVLYWIARQVIGRAAYPLFLTLFLEGALHWRNSWRHAADLVLFALLAEPVFDKALYGSWWVWGAQNVMWSWLLALIVICGFRVLETSRQDDGVTPSMEILAKVILVLLMMIFAAWLHVDYGSAGILFVAAGYVFLKRRPNAPLWQLGLLMSVLDACVFLTPGALLAVPVLYGYKPDMSGRRTFWRKYAAYVFYPAHLAVLAVLRVLFLN